MASKSIKNMLPFFSISNNFNIFFAILILQILALAGKKEYLYESKNVVSYV